MPSQTGETSGGLLPRLRDLASQPGSHLLLLRAFLGVTFTFAGLQKLANPAFFRASSPTGIKQQLADNSATSPVHVLVTLALHAPVLVGVLIALGELAVGLGTLFGLLSRAAACGGMLLSLSFFLTVSWQTSPYYYGADIVFLFAWTSIALHGATAPSLDVLLARRAAAAGAGPTGPAGAIGRREVISRGVLAGAGAATVVLLGGVVAAVGRAMSPSSHATGAGTGTTGLSTGGTGTTTTTAGGTGTTTTTAGGTGSTAPGTTAGSVPKGTKIGLASDVPVGGAASFTDPASGQPAYVVQPAAGDYLGFSAICTHEGCTVNFVRSTETFDCPCHGSIYNAKTGAVLQGPAPAPLPSIPIALGPGDELYADG
jgi:thiosulfate dehydrogenase [quinone] large subunit